MYITVKSYTLNCNICPASQFYKAMPSQKETANIGTGLKSLFLGCYGNAKLLLRQQHTKCRSLQEVENSTTKVLPFFAIQEILQPRVRVCCFFLLQIKSLHLKLP